jgi:hypothetical protein
LPGETFESSTYDLLNVASSGTAFLKGGINLGVGNSTIGGTETLSVLLGDCFLSGCPNVTKSLGAGGTVTLKGVGKPVLTYKKDDVYVDTQQFNSSDYEKVVKADRTIMDVYMLEFESSSGDFDEVQFSLASGTFRLKGLTIYLKSQN